jgi:hypothetical protein
MVIYTRYTDQRPCVVVWLRDSGELIVRRMQCEWADKSCKCEHGHSGRTRLAAVPTGNKGRIIRGTWAISLSTPGIIRNTTESEVGIGTWDHSAPVKGVG